MTLTNGVHRTDHSGVETMWPGRERCSHQGRIAHEKHGESGERHT